jgi:hypothetical protein
MEYQIDGRTLHVSPIAHGIQITEYISDSDTEVPIGTIRIQPDSGEFVFDRESEGCL